MNRSGSLGIVHYVAQVDDTWFVSSDKGMYAYLPNGELSQQYILDKYPEWKLFIHMVFNNSIHPTTICADPDHFAVVVHIEVDG